MKSKNATPKGTVKALHDLLSIRRNYFESTEEILKRRRDQVWFRIYCYLVFAAVFIPLNLWMKRSTSFESIFTVWGFTAIFFVILMAVAFLSYQSIEKWRMQEIRKLEDDLLAVWRESNFSCSDPHRLAALLTEKARNVARNLKSEKSCRHERELAAKKHLEESPREKKLRKLFKHIVGICVVLELMGTRKVQNFESNLVEDDQKKRADWLYAQLLKDPDFAFEE